MLRDLFGFRVDESMMCKKMNKRFEFNGVKGDEMLRFCVEKFVGNIDEA